MQRLKITVVTVCLNAADTIAATMESVLEQTYDNLEYLIIDGMSTDGTQEIIHRYEDDMRVRMVFEHDSGLYNAMNRSLDLCSGQYILYMNSGDLFYDKKVIEDMVPYLDADLVYGNTMRRKKCGDRIEKYHGRYKLFWLLLSGRMMSHQSLFTRTDIMRKFRFDEQYKISADYDFVVRAKKNGCSIKYVDRTVSIMNNVEGISAQIDNYEIMRAEDDKSLRKNYTCLYYLIKIPKGFVRCIRRIWEKASKMRMGL